MRRLTFIASLALVLMAAVALAMRRPVEIRETIYVFGTLVEIVIRDENEQVARAAVVSVGELLQELHSDWHAWKPGQLTNTNMAIAEGRAAPIDARLAKVLRHGKRLSCQSGGLFDPAIGELVALWGFHSDALPESAMPSPRDIADWRTQRPSMADVRIEGLRVSSAKSNVQFDLGGFAKGAALDIATDHLAELGLRNAVLNAGGDVNVMGHHSERPWRVAIRDPFVWGAVAGVSLEPGEVIYTSGNYERFFRYEGTRFSHILDPRTGAPVQDIVSVSVIDTQGARADAAATALAVAGVEDWPQVARDMGVELVLMITDDGRLLATPKMRNRLEPTDQGFPGEIETFDLPDRQLARCVLDP